METTAETVDTPSYTWCKAIDRGIGQSPRSSIQHITCAQSITSTLYALVLMIPFHICSHSLTQSTSGWQIKACQHLESGCNTKQRNTHVSCTIHGFYQTAGQMAVV